MVFLLLEVPVVQGECQPAHVFRKKRTGVPIHQEREFGSLGEHLCEPFIGYPQEMRGFMGISRRRPRAAFEKG
jgi:hypothetical protein